ncbi:uncharacterized protein FPRO_11219 [Fusarium proliferatum ET1]|uniref:Ricin B lectin domain-containing protein n=1 Tax=Fusarium proliferatum (strain ET1) TaxID=1227346 RepID=A0A1L7VPM2_FUSPR|nr:uncharacterized protein FPRO_11219 [Fusarium proliferatum ET1]CZR41630.1 uncharacterized protein FPRO_11219 [Fusarium proliferatum ET1]
MRGSSRRRGSQSTYQARSVTIDENGEEIIRLKKVIQVKTGASLKLREEMNEKAKELRPHMHDGHLKPAPAVPQSGLRFLCNIQSEIFRGNSNVFDLNGAVVMDRASGNPTRSGRSSQSLTSTAASSSRTRAKALSSFQVDTERVSSVRGTRTSRTLKPSGISEARPLNVNDNTQVRFRNAKDGTYLNLSGGSTANHTAFLTYIGHGGANQAFKLWKH